MMLWMRIPVSGLYCWKRLRSYSPLKQICQPVIDLLCHFTFQCIYEVSLCSCNHCTPRTRCNHHSRNTPPHTRIESGSQTPGPVSVVELPGHSSWLRTRKVWMILMNDVYVNIRTYWTSLSTWDANIKWPHPWQGGHSAEGRGPWPCVWCSEHSGIIGTNQKSQTNTH